MENNKLTTITQLPITEIMSIGKAFAESGMFADTKSAAQAIVKIQAGQEIGIPPFAAMTGIHIIQGKPTIGAGLMASRLKGSGKYDYRIIQQDEKSCSIDFYQGKEVIGNSTFTMEDAKKAQTKNIDKFPKNMLFARAMSNGVKWYTPDIFSGPVYVPEEMEPTNAIEDIQHTEVIDTIRASESLLLASNDITELQANWKLLTKEAQTTPSVIEVKEKMKLALTPVA